MAGTLPPLFDIPDDDEGGYAAVAVYTLLALTLVIVVARLSTRWYIGGVLHSDGILLICTRYNLSVYVTKGYANLPPYRIREASSP